MDRFRVNQNKLNSKGIKMYKRVIKKYPKAKVQKLAQNSKKSFGSHIAKIMQNFVLFRNFVVSIIIIFFIIPLIFFIALQVYKEIKSDTILIEPFEVSKNLQEMGFTGRAIANKLTNQINKIMLETQKLSTSAHIAIQSSENIELKASVPTGSKFDVEIPGSGVSLKAVMEFLGYNPTKISGELTNSNGENFELTVRVGDNPDSTIIGGLKNLNTMLLIAAKYVYKFAGPYILAVYFKDKDSDKDKSIETIEYIISNEPDDDDDKAYNLWGIILLENGDYSGAIEKFDKSTSINPVFSYPYNGWGIALYQLGRHEEAAEKFEKALELDPKYAAAYYRWGVALEQLKRFHEAIKKYAKAAAIDRDAEVGKQAQERIEELKKKG